MPAARPAGIPARLRAALSIGSWGRKPEPRVRYGQPFLPGLAALDRRHALAARALIEQAEAVRGRRFTHLGRTVGYPGRIDWEPRGLSVAWRTALNRLDELVALGVTAALAPTPDARRAWYEVTAALVADWIGGAQRGPGAAWSLPALAGRIPNLIHTQVLFAPELRAQPDRRRVWVESLWEQAETLAAALPAASADASRIAAGRALVMAGRFFDGMEARAWLEAGSTMLWKDLREQVHDDGGHRSRHPAEHARALADYLAVFALLRASTDDIPIWGRKRVKGMADFLSRLLHPDGELPSFHGATAQVAPPPRDLLATAAVLLHEPEFAIAPELGVWPFLLLGEPGRRVYASLGRGARELTPRALRRTGYYVLPGEPGEVMLLDGDTPPTGGAAGVFSFELSLGGERVIVHGGAGSEEPAPWGEHFASAAAHNTIIVDALDEAPTRRASGAVQISEVHWLVRHGIVHFAGVQAGFAGEVRHRRRIFCLPGHFWIVCDELLGDGTCRARSLVHFHPAVALRAVCHGRPALVATRSAAASATLVFARTAAIRLASGVAGPEPEGWYAPCHGERQPAPVVSGVLAGRLPLLGGYAILPHTSEPAALDVEHDGFHLRATLRAGDDVWVVTALENDLELEARGLTIRREGGARELPPPGGTPRPNRGAPSSRRCCE